MARTWNDGCRSSRPTLAMSKSAIPIGICPPPHHCWRRPETGWNSTGRRCHEACRQLRHIADPLFYPTANPAAERQPTHDSIVPGYFHLLLLFAKTKLAKDPSQLTMEEIDAPLISAFLDDLQDRRGIGARSRNLRLTAIRSFYRYASFEMPAQSEPI